MENAFTPTMTTSTLNEENERELSSLDIYTHAHKERKTVASICLFVANAIKIQHAE